MVCLKGDGDHYGPRWGYDALWFVTKGQVTSHHQGQAPSPRSSYFSNADKTSLAFLYWQNGLFDSDMHEAYWVALTYMVLQAGIYT